METRHNYEYDVNVDSNTAAAKVVRFVGPGKRVLEIGAGPGSITRILKEHNHCNVTAIELDPTAIEKLATYCDDVYQCDLNKHDWPQTIVKSGKFKAVVAADVLEHLYDPLATLSAIKEVLDDDGYVVVSLPHVAHHAIVACLLDEDFEYQPYGLLDKTHIRFFGIKNIQRLFNLAGFKIIEAEFVVRPPEQTEFAKKWRQLPADLKRSLAYNKFGTVYQVVIKAQPMPCAHPEVVLIEQPVPEFKDSPLSSTSLSQKIIRKIARILLPYLGLETRAKIRDSLKRLGIKY